MISHTNHINLLYMFVFSFHVGDAEILAPIVASTDNPISESHKL